MKKIFIAIAAMITAMSANAQVEQGKLFINGQFGVSSTSYKADDDLKVSSFTLTPRVGYFLSNQFAVGLGVGVSSNKTKNTTSNVTVTNTTSTVNISPFVRYYVPTSGDKFHFFAQSGLDFGFGKTKAKSSNTPNTQESKINTINFHISPGFAYFPSSHWSAELLLNGFYIDSQKNPDNDNDGNNKTTIGLDINSLVPSVGISYFF